MNNILRSTEKINHNIKLYFGQEFEFVIEFDKENNTHYFILRKIVKGFIFNKVTEIIRTSNIIECLNNLTSGEKVVISKEIGGNVNFIILNYLVRKEIDICTII